MLRGYPSSLSNSVDPADSANFVTIGNIAAAAGVSVQTIRIWEKLGHIAASRSAGGQRLFSEAAVRYAAEFAAAARRKKDESRVRPAAGSPNAELASTGMRIRQARMKKGLSQTKAAATIGISRSFLAAVERGETGVSVRTLSRMADVFSIPMSKFASSMDRANRVMREADRPRTEIAGGVSDLEPAVLEAPPGQTSGGLVLCPGDIFVFVLEGAFDFQFEDSGESVELAKGDAVTVKAGTPFAWKNSTAGLSTCLWIENITSLRRSAD